MPKVEIPEIANIRIIDGAILLDWLCPRCGEPQTSVLKGTKALMDGGMIACQNVGYCGQGNSALFYEGLNFKEVAYVDEDEVPHVPPQPETETVHEVNDNDILESDFLDQDDCQTIVDLPPGLISPTNP
jgi:hypothetical protein